jgi:hypothetical protein
MSFCEQLAFQRGLVQGDDQYLWMQHFCNQVIQCVQGLCRYAIAGHIMENHQLINGFGRQILCCKFPAEKVNTGRYLLEQGISVIIGPEQDNITI